MPALVMNCFAPSMTHSPSFRRGPRAGVPRVRAGVGLRQAEGSQPFARAQLRHPLALLLLGAEQVDRLRAQRGVGAQRDRDGGVDPRELLDRERVGERVAARAAVLLRERDAHQVQLAQLAHDLVREGLRAVELLGDGGDLALGEFPDGAADQLVVWGEVEVHGRAFSQVACHSIPPSDHRAPDTRLAQARRDAQLRPASLPASRPAPAAWPGPAPGDDRDPRRRLAPPLRQARDAAARGRSLPARLGCVEHRVPPRRRRGRMAGDLRGRRGGRRPPDHARRPDRPGARVGARALGRRPSRAVGGRPRQPPGRLARLARPGAADAAQRYRPGGRVRPRGRIQALGRKRRP